MGRVASFVMVTTVAALGVVACSKKTEPPKDDTPAASAQASAAPSAAPSAAASAAPSAAAAAGKMAHCPNTVEGATTVVKDGPSGVVLTVTAKDAKATEDIRDRAKFLADSAKNASPEVKHNGTGEGGGVFGRCPVVMRNTEVTNKDVEGGAEIAVKTKDPKELDWLRYETRDRQKEIGDPNAKEAGQGRMAHCPSAVTGASTVIADTKDGFDVTVTGKDEATTKEIRDRGTKLVAASKIDSKTIAHNGSGSGGGGYGRCPVVLEDTTVTSKEVPGGATFSVKPAKATELANVRKEARERALAFTAK